MEFGSEFLFHADKVERNAEDEVTIYEQPKVQSSGGSSQKIKYSNRQMKDDGESCYFDILDTA
eukprot:Awhi_evm1s11611